ncbi:hypothetical protein [Catenuloplanes japonicus]|uniref:hypothetical protein n=1 Tax=Catenuloplanes japonicus TaxID=33876 RepID=UPI0005264EEE|nr:hypothetical protein [Catenuloplanes japonicus]
MELSLSPRHQAAICVDHVLPTRSGVHVHTEPISARNTDPRVRRLATMPGRAGHTYVSFGAEIDAGLAGADGPRGNRGRAVLFQYLRGLPAEAADRVVLRPLDPHGLTLLQAAARADLAGLPIEIARADLRPSPAGEPPIAPARLIGLTAAWELTTVADAEILWVTPARHRATGAYAEAGPEALAAVLTMPYPPARVVLDGDGGVRLGLPAALAAHAHGVALAGLRRPLDARDLPETAGVPVAGYGDLLAALDRPGARAFVTAGDAVLLAVHDHTGLSVLDPATGGAALLPAAPDRITLHPVEDGTDLTAWIGEIAARRPGGTRLRPIRHVAGVHPIPLGDTGRTVDVVGRAGALTSGFLTRIAAAASAVDAPVVLIATDRPSAPPSPGQLHRLEWLLFQHQRNQRAGGPAPIVVVRGDPPPAVTALLDRYDFATVQQPRAALGSGGFGLNLDNPWVARDPGGRQVAPPSPAVTGDLLTAVARAGRTRAPRPVEVDERLADLLSTPLDDVAAIRDILAAHGSALRTLSVTGLATQPDLFAGWAAILRIDGRGDAGLAEAAYDYLGAGKSALSAVPSLLERGAETRGEGLADLIDLTKGPLDDGAGRAILGAITAGVEGAPLEEVQRVIHQHSAYLPRSGRTGWIRELQDLSRRSPQHRALFEQVAIFVETCP